MTRRKWTDEERKAQAERMRALQARRAHQDVDEKPATEVVAPKLEPSQSATEDMQGESELDQLKRHVKELESLIRAQAPQGQQGPQVTSGGVRGTLVKFTLDPKSYPSPVDRLFEERTLTIQGFNRDWYDVEWEVGRVNYPTKDGLNVTEPKFQVRLVKIIPDEEGMPSKKRFIFHKMTFFEDPDAAIQVAQQYGLEVAEELQKNFLDEMRYLRVRDWVRESFYPPKPVQKRMNKTEQVIGNRLVEVFEANSEDSTKIPFDQINKKL